jgi:hypothetical protein
MAAREGSVDCPRCRRPLLVLERLGIELDYCPACPGFWFDAGELDLLAEKNGLPSAEHDVGRFALAQTEEAARPCPRCDRAMQKVWFDPGRTILLDRCAHGLWFDRGEAGRALDSIRPAAPGAPATIVSFLGETFRR